MVGRDNPAREQTLSPAEVQATFCATLVDEWIRLGVRHAVIAPGSRSTPMALAITDQSPLAVHVMHDERVAGFVALGLGLEGLPAILLCTSGTAAANFLPAVVEANLSDVPLLVVTADRPAELRGVGAPQTIDQIELYGRHVGWFHDAPVAEAGAAPTWRTLAGDAWAHAIAGGPVHVNLQFAEPLQGAPGELPPIAPAPERSITAHVARRPARDVVPDAVRSERGVILVGGRSGVSAMQVAELHDRTCWPIIADPMSHMRHLDGVVTSADTLHRVSGFADRIRPEVIVRVGRPASSKVLAQAMAAAGATMIQVGGPGRIDPERNVVAVCSIDDVLVAVPQRRAGGTWLATWLAGDEVAQQVIADFLAGCDDLTEPGAARTVAEHLPDDAVLTVASSMPVRDLEWFGGRRARAHANRGANGIDGVMSTALGRALDGVASVVLIGDLAFVHDANALVGLMARGMDLRVVVVDNDGGGIFSFLPQATSLPHDRFEQLFGTPLGVDVLGLAAAHRIPTSTVTTTAGLAAQLAAAGPWVARVPSDRVRNVEIHDQLNAAVAAALETAFA